MELPPHATEQRDVETVIGHFVDAAWAYRFGPPAQDAIVVSLERDGPDSVDLLSQAFHFPAGRPLGQEPEHRLGLAATAATGGDGTVRLSVTSRRLAYGVRIHATGFAPTDDAFSVEPGGSRTIALVPTEPGSPYTGGTLSAINLSGSVVIRGGEKGA